MSLSRGRCVAAPSLMLLTLLAAPAPGAQAAVPVVRLVGLINDVRARHLQPPLRVDARLAKAARAHSRDMIRRDYFAHGDLSARFGAFGVRSPLIGENLAWTSGGTVLPAEILGLWMHSPMHRKILLTRGFHRIGIALPVGPFQGYRAAVVATADFSA